MSWNEGKHERDADGRFAPKGSAEVAASASTASKSYTLPGLGTFTKEGSKTTIQVSWLGKAALETAAGAAVVAALPGAVTGAVGIAANGLAGFLVDKVGASVGRAALAGAAEKLAAKIGAKATKAAAKSIATKAAVGVIERHTVGSNFLKLLKDKFRGVQIDTEPGWFRPSTITIDRTPPKGAVVSMATLRKAAIEFSWDESKHRRGAGGRFVSLEHAEAANDHLKSSLAHARALLRPKALLGHHAPLHEHERHVTEHEEEIDRILKHLADTLGSVDSAPPVLKLSNRGTGFQLSLKSLAAARTQFDQPEWEESKHKRDAGGRFASVAHASAVASHYHTARGEAHDHLFGAPKPSVVKPKKAEGSGGESEKRESPDDEVDGGESGEEQGGSDTDTVPPQPKPEKTEAEKLKLITASVRRKELRIIRAIATLKSARESAGQIPAPDESPAPAQPEPAAGQSSAAEPPGHAERMERWKGSLPAMLPYVPPIQKAWTPPKVYAEHRDHMDPSDAHYEDGKRLLAHIKNNVAHQWMYDAIGTAKKAGWQIPPTIRNDSRSDRANGWLDPGDGHLHLTTYRPTTEIQAEKRWEVEKGFASQENTMLHEMAHWQHLQAIGPAAMVFMLQHASRRQEKGLSGFKSSEHEAIGKQVSDRASRSPLEFVAEAYAGHAVGKRYSDEVRSLFHALTDGKLTI
jgi:hypothetical protein